MLLLSLMTVLLAAAVNPAQGQEIQIKGNSVIMSCTGGVNDKVKWFKNSKDEISGETSQTHEVTAERGMVKGHYSCVYKSEPDAGPQEDTRYEFYLKVKVCENCHELSTLRVWGVILGDVLFTGGVILIIYVFATRNSDSTQKKASNSRSVNPPRPPNPDYEALDPKMRSSNALYAGLNK